MKPRLQLPCFLLLISIIVGCTISKPSIQPTSVTQSSYSSIPSETFTPEHTRTSTVTAKITSSPTPSSTLTQIVTLNPVIAQETIQPLTRDPMNCAVPCFWGIIPGQTKFNDAKDFFTILGFIPFEGIDSYTGREFYTIEFTSSNGLETSVSLLPINKIVENIMITPHISKLKAGNPREWIAYSQETLIRKFGKPSRVEIALDYGPNFVIVMNMYFDETHILVRYSGYNMLPDRPDMPLVCPLVLPFDHVRLYLGKNPPNPPSNGTPIEQATSITIDQFTQLMLGDPQKACFVVNGDLFK